MKKITLIGTGIMGAPMARNIAKGGYEVTVWNRTREKAEALSDVCTVADTAAGAVADADAIITMVENGAIVTEICFGEPSAAAASKEGALFIDMSSIQPAVARDLAEKLGEMGRRHLDSPVSGGQVGAEEGTLAIMTGGDDADFAEAEPLLKTMGTPTHTGPHGAGQVAKLANQQIVGITIGAVAEALLLAQAGGCDPVAVRKALMGGFATSRILELHGQRMIDRNWVPGGPLQFQLKDLNNTLEVAKANGLSLPLTEKARDAFHALTHDLEMTGQDHAAYLRWLEAINGDVRLGDKPDRAP